VKVAEAARGTNMSNQDAITYGQLRSILELLGYTRDATRSGDDHVTFAHAGPGRSITLPVYPDEEKVHKIYLVAIRGGLKLSMPQALGHFDRMLLGAGSKLFEYASVT
jgi:hypothetical protein